jgi:transposase
MMSLPTWLLSSRWQGGCSCPVLLVPRSNWPPNSTCNSRLWSARAPRPRRWLSAAASSCGQPAPSCPPISRLPRNWTATAIPSASGGNGLPPRAWPACKTRLVAADPATFPPDERLQVLTLASSATDALGRPATRWSLDDLAATILNQAHHRAISRSTIWRILDAVDLKPHKSIYWLNSHDPNFTAIAQEVCRLYVQAPMLAHQGHLLLCTDEKSGMQILERCAPTRPAVPGHPARRERDYVRHGTRTLLTSFAVPTGEVLWDLGPTRTNEDFAGHLLHALEHFLAWDRITWVLDNLNIHWSLQACEVLASVNNRVFQPRALRTGAQRRAFLTDPDYPYRFVFLPKHGSWLNQVELWFSVLVRQFLQRGDFTGVTDFAQRLQGFLEDYNAAHAHPYRWTYAGEPLVRGTPFSQTRRQQRHGRAWCSPRPPPWQRALFAVRPYQRRVA